jgi:hypothetical protein
MTQQEFVKKESDHYANVQDGDFAKIESLKLMDDWHQTNTSFSDGLSKGLEIAKGALKYARENAVSGNDGCWDFNPHDQVLQSLTDDELLTIFLTEKYGQ